jgi:hypothetical protein
MRANLYIYWAIIAPDEHSRSIGPYGVQEAMPPALPWFSWQNRLILWPAAGIIAAATADDR